MGYQNILVAAQLSAITSPNQAEEIPVDPTNRSAHTQRLPPTDAPSNHAIYSTVFHSEWTGTILLRVVDGGITVELVSLSTELPPVRFVFPAPVLPNPNIFEYGPEEIHVLAVTEHGSIYRLVIPVGQGGGLWRQPFTKNWTREYAIKNMRGSALSGLVQVQGPTCVAVGLQDGTLLRVEAEVVGSEHEEGESFSLVPLALN
jgi:nuclear pore complex protein Nup160